MSTAEIQTVQSDHILEIRMNRPDKRNALTAEMYSSMADALAVAAEDPAIRVVLIAGNGGSFTAGNDLKDFVARPPLGTNSPTTRFLEAIATAPKPLVAAVHGHAVGIGTTMLLHCDFVVAADSARLQLPFVNLGVVPEAASSLLLPRALGHLRAAELFLLGEPFSAETALSYGLVTRVVPEAELALTARALCLTLAAKPPAALRHTKALMKATDTAVAARMAEEGLLFRALLNAPEAKEAVAAFFEKRKPNFG